MAVGDVTVFDEALLALLDGTHDLDTNVLKTAVLRNTTPPTVADASPTLGSYTEVTTTATYLAGGTTCTISLTEAAGVVTFDSTTNPSWTQDGSGDANAYWGLLYDSTAASDEAIAFIELGGPVDMSANDLTINWGASGIFALTVV